MSRLDGKIALITGAASKAGIGFAAARASLRDGASVILTDIDEAAIGLRATELGQGTVGLRQDVTSGRAGIRSSSIS